MKRNYTIIPLFLLLFVAMVACSNKSRNNADSEGSWISVSVNYQEFSDEEYSAITLLSFLSVRVSVSMTVLVKAVCFMRFFLGEASFRSFPSAR